MRVESKHNSRTNQNEPWYVCPFCHTQRAVDAALAASKADDAGELLTQPASHP